jgi:hypothetical protein
VKARDDWQDEIPCDESLWLIDRWRSIVRSKLDAIGDGIHCQQAHLPAEYAARIVEKNLPEAQLCFALATRRPYKHSSDKSETT